ncbi:MAG: UDP-N-acetylmuramoyl-tripeptide--D-alanyl-D-alanine ligase [Vicinamibacterales bacterium]
MATPVPLTAGVIAAASGGRLRSGDPGRVIDGFAIDSRRLAAGDLFFAIVAARDGHDFVVDAVQRGAAGVVVARPVDVPGAGPEGPVVIEVPETTRALQDLARHVRRASGATVVAITGSAGKTTTKEAIAALLEARYRVVKNAGNLNNHLGLPLSLLELRHGADVAVMELGMNHAGEIRVLTGIAEPEWRVWTNVGEAHLGFFGTAEGIADAKAEILEGARPSDCLVANADDARVMARAPRFAGEVRTFGAAEGATVRQVAVEARGIDGSHVSVATPAGPLELDVPLLGRGNVANVLAAVTVALGMDVPLDTMAGRIARMAPAPHRGAVRRLGKGVTLVDDSYNSSPSALERALEVIGAETRCARRAAVLGEMLELGEASAELHRRSGRAAAAAGLARLVTVGGEPARALGDAATEAGMPPTTVTHVDTSADAADVMASWLAPGDLVLVKGSRGTRTDVVVNRIEAEFA